jgi:hypothetical protein
MESYGKLVTGAEEPIVAGSDVEQISASPIIPLEDVKGELKTEEERPVAKSGVNDNPVPPTEQTGNIWDGDLADDPETRRTVGNFNERMEREVRNWKLGKPVLEALREKGDSGLSERIIRLGREKLLNQGIPSKDLEEERFQQRIRESGTDALIQRLGEDVFLDMARKEEIKAQRIEKERREQEEREIKRRKMFQGIEDRRPINRVKRGVKGFFKQLFARRER